MAGLIVAAAAAAQIAFLWAAPKGRPPEKPTDFVVYYEPVARSILAGEGITRHGGPAVRYPPGFPAALAGIFWGAGRLGVADAAAVTAVNVAAAALSAALVFLVAQIIFGTRVGVWAALLWATYPLNLWLSREPNSEVFFIPLVLAGAYLWLRAAPRAGRGGALAAGAAWGAAALVRPAGLFLPFAAAAGQLVFPGSRRPARMVAAGITLAAFAAAVAPWVIYAGRATGRFVPLSVGGPPTIINGLSFTATRTTPAWPAVPAGVRALGARVAARTPTPASWRGLAACVADEARREPGAFAALVALKMARSWYGTDDSPYERYLFFIQAAYLALAAAGAVVAFRRYPDRRPAMAGLAVAVAGFYLAAVTGLSIVRYMVPAMAFVLVFAAVPAAAVFRRRERAGRR